jgi:predicted nuclease with TOPRIM domain
MNEEHLEDAQKRIEMLENELNRKDEEMEQLKKDLYQAQGRLQEIREEKEELTQQVSKFELMQMDLELMKAREVYEENNRLQHRIHVTKKLLDEARVELEFREKVINELENLKIMDRLRNKPPASLIIYKNR